MSKLRMVTLFGLAVIALAAAGCSGGGGGGGGAAVVATATSMKDVTPPANAGMADGFVYSSVQSVAVDIALPYPGIVTIYDKRPKGSIYDSPTDPKLVEDSVVLARGFSSTVADVNKHYHYTTTITVPTAAKSFYVIPMVGLIPSTAEVPVSSPMFTFTKGGAS